MMLKFLLEKEFKQFIRNRMFMRLIIALPVIQLLILPWAADYEIKNINIAVVDHDHSMYSTRLVNKIVSSGYFNNTLVTGSREEAFRTIEKNENDVVIEFPADFEKHLVTEGHGNIDITADAVNGMKAGLGSAYIGNIAGEFSRELIEEQGQNENILPVPQVEIIPQYRFNPFLNYQTFMVPGIMVMLVTLIGGFLAALNIVREKEDGTIEQINVTPVSKMYFILAKLIPLWCAGFVVITISLIIARGIYGIVPQGSLLTIYGFAFVYMISFSGLGILISTVASNQQQAMFLAFFFTIIFFLTCGLFSPVTSMPEFIQKITLFNPVRYFVEVIRLVMLKGSGFADILPQFFAVLGFGVLFNGLAIWSYKKR